MNIFRLCSIGLGPAQHCVLYSVIHPLFRQKSVVWWVVSTKPNHVAQQSKINRAILLQVEYSNGKFGMKLSSTHVGHEKLHFMLLAIYNIPAGFTSDQFKQRAKDSWINTMKEFARTDSPSYDWCRYSQRIRAPNHIRGRNKTSTKLDCLTKMNNFAASNHLTLLWVPGQM